MANRSAQRWRFSNVTWLVSQNAGGFATNATNAANAANAALQRNAKRKLRRHVRLPVQQFSTCN